MMLFKNDIFQLAEPDGVRSPDGPRYRYLATKPIGDDAWVIELGKKRALPLRMGNDLLNKRARKVQPDAGEVIAHTASDAMRLARDNAWMRIERLVSNPHIFEAEHRGRILRERAREVGVSDRTLLKYLRQYWLGGQTPDALLPAYGESGRPSNGRVTANRGRKATVSKHAVFQMSDDDINNIKTNIEKYYFSSECKSISASLQNLLETKYFYVDGNNKRCTKLFGNRPTRRQFENILYNEYSVEKRIRGRKGDKEFEQNHRGTTGSVDADCRGPGHIYEIDATIGDIYLVSSEDALSIIGNPTPASG
jgi:putative transposase